MNEHHQHDLNLDSNHNNSASDPSLAPETIPNPSQKPLTNPIPIEQPLQQQNEIDYTQPDFSVTHNFSGYSNMRISNTSHSHLLDSNSIDYHNQNLSSSYEQPDYGMGQNYYDNTLDPQDYNGHLESSYGGDFNNHQRTGKMVTLNELGEYKIGDIISEDGKYYKVVDYSPINGGYDVIRVEHYPDGTYREQGSTNTFLPKPDATLEDQNN